MIALVLLVPAPSIGALSAMIFWPQTLLGSGLFTFSKIWLFGFPVIWHFLIDKGKMSWSPAKKGGFGFGLLSGLLISAGMTMVFITLGDTLMDFPGMKIKLSVVGLDNEGLYLGVSAYWILVNSVLEEYVWRWFVVRKCEDVFGYRFAIPMSALFFTLHHIAAMSGYMDWWPVLICSTGVFMGGVIWSYMYSRYRSIWPGYLSHAIVDLCIFVIGAKILFG